MYEDELTSFFGPLNITPLKTLIKKGYTRVQENFKEIQQFMSLVPL